MRALCEAGETFEGCFEAVFIGVEGLAPGEVLGVRDLRAEVAEGAFEQALEQCRVVAIEFEVHVDSRSKANGNAAARESSGLVCGRSWFRAVGLLRLLENNTQQGPG
jgi:hypothetical protein